MHQTTAPPVQCSVAYINGHKNKQKLYMQLC